MLPRTAAMVRYLEALLLELFSSFSIMHGNCNAGRAARTKVYANVINQRWMLLLLMLMMMIMMMGGRGL